MDVWSSVGWRPLLERTHCCPPTKLSRPFSSSVQLRTDPVSIWKNPERGYQPTQRVLILPPLAPHPHFRLASARQTPLRNIACFFPLHPIVFVRALALVGGLGYPKAKTL